MYFNMDFVDFSSDEEDYVQPDIILREEQDRRERPNHMFDLSDEQFFMRFRLTKQSVLLLTEQIEESIKPKALVNDALTAVEKVLLTLRFFATGNFLITCGDFSGIHKSTACKTVTTVSKAIAELRPQYIRMPDGQEALSNKFYDIGKFARVVGVIDCTHVRIQSPGGDEPEVYRNRKMYFSINAQVVGGPDRLISKFMT
ncbi:hypothetical protein M8J75_008491 [Diaphorina citri]|nr:hypothetical protein M8J75_008491 [Diaphorina citri]